MNTGPIAHRPEIAKNLMKNDKNRPICRRNSANLKHAHPEVDPQPRSPQPPCSPEQRTRACTLVT